MKMPPTNKGIQKIIADQQIIRKMTLEKTVKEYFLRIYRIVKAVIMDLISPVDLSPRLTLKAWRHGFLRFHYRMYGLAQAGNPGDYVSDYATFKHRAFTGEFGELLSNKMAFSLLMKHHGMPTPDIRGVMQKGHFYPLSTDREMALAKSLEELLEFEAQLVLKPIFGCHGTGVFMLKRSINGYKVNGNDIPPHTLNNLFKKLENYLVTEFVPQGEYGTRLYPDTINTLRVVTFFDAKTAQPFIGKVVQRIGTSRSYPVDNFKAGGGGLSASVDLDTGELGPGAMVDAKGLVTWHALHPESNARIKGVVVPSWDNIQNSILECSQQLPFTPYIGWDIVITHSGFSIIEGNQTTGMPVLQVHGPMFTDSRIRRFYEYHGVVS